MSTDNRQLPDEQNKKMAKSQDPRLQTKQEGDPHMNENGAGDVGAITPPVSRAAGRATD